MDCRDLNRQFIFKRRQDARQSLSKHGFANARASHETQMMTSRCGDL
jgi:hypothetical protein